MTYIAALTDTEATIGWRCVPDDRVTVPLDCLRKPTPPKPRAPSLDNRA